MEKIVIKFKNGEFINITADTIEIEKNDIIARHKGKIVAMAKIKVEQLEFGEHLVLAYEVDEELMKSLKILHFNEYSEDWAKFILLNRRNPASGPAHDYDIVYGPIADDRVGVQLWKYENQSIDLHTLVNNLQYIKGMTFQYFFGTQEAIRLLHRK